MELEAEILAIMLAEVSGKLKVLLHLQKKGRPGSRYCGWKIKLADSSWFLPGEQRPKVPYICFSHDFTGVYFQGHVSPWLECGQCP